MKNVLVIGVAALALVGCGSTAEDAGAVPAPEAPAVEAAPAPEAEVVEEAPAAEAPAADVAAEAAPVEEAK
jgi:PBP1b-binding outer membrane lipoprotein LpoB